MESIANTLRTLFTNYGFQSGLIIITTVVITNFIKKPIMSLALKQAEKTGLDKSVITRYITLVPFVVSFILVFVVQLLAVEWKITALDFSLVTSQATVYAAISVATYESIKKQLQAYASKSNTPIEVKDLDEIIKEEQPNE